VPTQRRPTVVSRRAYDREGFAQVGVYENFKRKMSRHEGTYVLQPASQPAGRAIARELRGSAVAASGFWVASGTRDRSPRVRGDPRRRPRDRRAAGNVPLTRDTSRELPWPRRPNVRGQMAAHGENSREFMRIFDVFPKNPRGSATIFDFLTLQPTARSSATTSDQLSDRPRFDRFPFQHDLSRLPARSPDESFPSAEHIAAFFLHYRDSSAQN